MKYKTCSTSFREWCGMSQWCSSSRSGSGSPPSSTLQRSSPPRPTTPSGSSGWGSPGRGRCPPGWPSPGCWGGRSTTAMSLTWTTEQTSGWGEKLSCLTDGSPQEKLIELTLVDFPSSWRAFYVEILNIELLLNRKLKCLIIIRVNSFNFLLAPCSLKTLPTQLWRGRIESKQFDPLVSEFWLESTNCVSEQRRTLTVWPLRTGESSSQVRTDTYLLSKCQKQYKVHLTVRLF